MITFPTKNPQPTKPSLEGRLPAAKPISIPIPGRMVYLCLPMEPEMGLLFGLNCTTNEPDGITHWRKGMVEVEPISGTAKLYRDGWQQKNGANHPGKCQEQNYNWTVTVGAPPKPKANSAFTQVGGRLGQTA